jgi:YebC/PmpR family DNA-binding regulatory protein
MAGHSKWANIKFRKGAQDAKRGKAFTKLIREITIATRMGGSDHTANPRLRAALSAARAQNMPKDTMTKAVKRGTGELQGVNYDEVRFEGYGPGGVAMIVDTLTDNNTRTVANVRHLFTKHGGNLGTSGCVAFLFDNKGAITYQDVNEDVLIEAALEAGAEDIMRDGDTFEVITDPTTFDTVLEALKTTGLPDPQTAEVTMRPQTTTTLDAEQAESMLKLMDALDDDEDVQKVYANFDIPDDILERLTA